MPIDPHYPILAALLALASCAPRPPTPSPTTADVVIEDVTLVDVREGRTREHLDVGLAGPRIAYVRRAGGAAVPAGARRVSGRGLFLIPGLWDMHSHSLWSADAVRTFLPAYVANGVTGIRDMGGTLEMMHAARDSIRGGSAYPRIYAAGAIVDGPEPVDPSISLAVGDSAGGRLAVDSLARAGADFVKVYSLLPRGAYFAVMDEARRLGIPVAGHVPVEVTPDEAARAGQRSIEHLRDELEPFCTPREPAPCAPLFEVFRRNGTWQVPTLVVLRMKALFGDTAYVTDPRLAYVPASLRASWLRERLGKIARGPDYAAGKRVRFADEMWLTGRLARERVPLMAGTDAGVAFSYPGFSLHDELALLVDAGLSNVEALRAATLAPAELMGAAGTLGTVEAGRAADLVLLRANPLRDIRATRQVETVVLRGRVIPRAGLDSLLAAVARDAR
jgi:imidazolonepropionase-like amidohydrolase